MVYIRVAVNLPSITGEFDYHLTPEMEGHVGVGQLLRVPFGGQVVQGLVLEFVSQPSVPETKAALELVDEKPVLTLAQILLARQLAEATLNPLAALLWLMIPPGLAQQADSLYSLSRSPASTDPLNTVQKRLLAMLEERGPLRGRQIDRHFGPLDWRKPAQALVRGGLLKSKPVLPPPTVRPKFIRVAQLAVTPEQSEAAMPTLGKTAATLERRQQALRFLAQEAEPVAVAWVYAQAGCNLADLQELAERELIILYETEIFRDPLRKTESRELEHRGAGENLVLTAEQDAALAEILHAFQPPPSDLRLSTFDLQSPASDLQPPSTFLLHGVTASGKTEIYLRAVAETLRRGKQALILVPEIALTPQTVRRFMLRFPGRVGLIHSKLSDGERYDTWRRARDGQLQVIIGARSALFAPLPNPGLIVVDECHDHSYYQSEPPFYHAVRAAQMYARICGAVCILGSATPPVELVHSAETGTKSVLRLLELSSRVVGPQENGVFSLPPVSVVDMREELKTGNRGIFSRELAESLAETLERGEQAILFLNRRGTATYVFCRDCGYVAKCPHCDTPLTYHVEESALSSSKGQKSKVGAPDLRCHRCGYSRQMLKTCPNCKSAQIRAFGLGSEKVEAEVQALFPAARTLRWDWETTRERDAHEIILTHFANHQADVLVGTQMLAKGLDFPLVTLVGIVLAEVGLTLPDPFAAERTFQVLTQVAGRAGRSARGGKVVMQTFMPEHYVIQAASRHAYADFYAQEIGKRRELGYPPFARLLRLEFRHRDNAEAEQQAHKLAATLRARLESQNTHSALRNMPENLPRLSNYDLLGPTPCFFAKMNDFYRWQIILRGPDPVALLQGKIPAGWRLEVEPPALL